jgi:hypothetical protein
MGNRGSSDSSTEDIATEMEDDRRFASLERVYRPDPDA